MHGLSTLDFYPFWLTWLQPLLSAQYASSGNQQRSQYGTITQGNQLAMWQQADYTGTLPSQREKSFVLNGQTFQIQISIQNPSLHPIFLPNLHLLTYRMLIHHHDILHSIASNQGTHFTTHEVWPRKHAHGIQWSYYVLHHPERRDPEISGMAF